MAIETVQIVVDENWTLLSAAAAGIVDARVIIGRNVLFSFGASEPTSRDGSFQARFSSTSFADKVWARCPTGLSTLSVIRTVDAGNPTLPAIGTLTLSNGEFQIGAAGGTEIGAFGGLAAGDVIDRIVPNDGRLVLNGERTKLLKGLTASEARAFKIKVYVSNPKVPGYPKAFDFTITPVAGGGGGVVPYPLPTPVLMEAYDSVTGFAFAGEALAIDTVIKVQGAGSLVVKDTGAQQRAIKNIGVQPDPQTWGTVATFTDTGDDPLYANRGAVGAAFANTNSIGGGNTIGSASNGNLNYRRSGKIWGAAHVSENATVSALGAGTKFIGTPVGVAPFGTTLKVDATYRNAEGIPEVYLSYDDGFLSQYARAFPELKKRGLLGNIMVPWDNIGTNGVRIDGRMLDVEIKEMYDAGVMAICLDGTGNDNRMILRANPAEVVAELARGKQWLIDKGLSTGKMGFGWDIFCYPEGTVDDESQPIQIAALTGNGTDTVVALSAAPATTVVAGMSIGGYGIPRGTTIGSVQSQTQFTLATPGNVPIPNQTKPAVVLDMRGPFAPGKLQKALKAAGFKIGRTVLEEHEYVRMGFDVDQGLLMGAVTTTGATSSSLITKVQKTQLRGTAFGIFIHNHDDTRDLPFYDFLATEQQANRLRVRTYPQMRDDYAGLKLAA